MLHCLTNQSLQRQRRLLPGLEPGPVPGFPRGPQVRLHVDFSFLSLLRNIRTRGVQAIGKHTTVPGLRKAKNPPSVPRRCPSGFGHPREPGAISGYRAREGRGKTAFCRNPRFGLKKRKCPFGGHRNPRADPRAKGAFHSKGQGDASGIQFPNLPWPERAQPDDPRCGARACPAEFRPSGAG